MRGIFGALAGLISAGPPNAMAIGTQDAEINDSTMLFLSETVLDGLMRHRLTSTGRASQGLRSHNESNRMARRNLVFAVGDEKASHLNWAMQSPSRSWDITLSYFGPAGRAPAQNYDRIEPQGRGVKWGAITSFFKNNPRVIESYGYVWFPDDDILCDPQDINRLFACMQQYDLDIAQPSLTEDSYFSHLITLRQPGYVMRLTNFVEVMMPCLKTSYLEKLLPRLEGSYTGWGMDFGWADVKLTRRAGVIDAIGMTHARPVGGGQIYRVAAQQGLETAKEEAALAFDRFDVSLKIAFPRGGIRKDGRAVVNKWGALIDFYCGLRKLQPKYSARAQYTRSRYKRRIWKEVRRIVRYHISGSTSAKLRVSR